METDTHPKAPEAAVAAATMQARQGAEAAAELQEQEQAEAAAALLLAATAAQADAAKSEFGCGSRWQSKSQ